MRKTFHIDGKLLQEITAREGNFSDVVRTSLERYFYLLQVGREELRDPSSPTLCNKAIELYPDIDCLVIDDVEKMALLDACERYRLAQSHGFNPDPAHLLNDPVP